MSAIIRCENRALPVISFVLERESTDAEYMLACSLFAVLPARFDGFSLRADTTGEKGSAEAGAGDSGEPRVLGDRSVVVRSGGNQDCPAGAGALANGREFTSVDR